MGRFVWFVFAECAAAVVAYRIFGWIGFATLALAGIGFTCDVILETLKGIALSVERQNS